MDIFSNPWAIGIGTTVIGGVIAGVILHRLLRKSRQTESPTPDAPGLPASTPATITAGDDRVFVNRTPEELTQPFRELTDYQAKRATEVLLNKCFG